MRRAALLPFDVSKEFRGLAGAWLACLTALVIPAAMAVRATRALEILAYFLGVAALGALSIGHEYRHSTLTLLHSQPRSRARLFLVKQGVLAAMLLTLAAVAGAVVDLRARESATLAFAVLPVLCGLFVAPWLTMLCRNPLAGTVFAVALPGLLFTVSELLYVATYGHAPGADVEMAIVWRATLGLCAVAAVMSWWMFMRLESIDGRGPEVQLPEWLQGLRTTSIAAPALTKRRPLWMLITKELWLQQTALDAALATPPPVWLWVGDWGPPIDSAGSSARTPIEPILWRSDPFTGIHLDAGGAQPSAEERRLGTLEWQNASLRDVEAVDHQGGAAHGWRCCWRSRPSGARWRCRSGCRQPVLSALRSSRWASPCSRSSASMYPRCTSDCRLISLPVIFGVGLPATVWLGSYGVHSVAARRSAEKAWASVGMTLDDGGRLMSLLALLLVAAILAVALRFALENHRSTAHAGRRVWTQVILMSICAVVGALLLTGMAALS